MVDLIFGVIFSFAVVIVCFFLFYKFLFLRDPGRDVPSGNNLVSPADGKVIKIIRIRELGNAGKVKIKKGFFGKINSLVPDNCKGGYLINIMMDLFNVHVQRAPLNGKVLSVKHTKGGFKNAVYGDNFENGLGNEKNEILIDNDKIGKFKVIQIAGFVARRIECFVKEKDKINKGHKIGRILLGSQVSLIIPGNITLLAREGDKVKAGETILGELN